MQLATVANANRARVCAVHHRLSKGGEKGTRVARFEEEMRRAVTDIAAEHGLTEDKAFSVWYCGVAFRLDRQEAIDASRFDRGNDQGIDIFYVDDELQTVVIAQAKYYARSTKAPYLGELALLLDTPESLAEAQSLRDDGRPDLAEAADDLRAARDQGYVIRLQMVYPGIPRPGLERLVRSFNKAHAEEDLAAELIPLTELDVIHADYMGSGGRVSTGVLSLVGHSSYEQSGSYGKAMVATVSGSSIKALYDTHGDRLFDQNVRLYLGARKGSVNAAIRSTIENSGDRGNFWAYNNGITVVARSFTRRPRRGVVELQQFSIVNGCQTTVLIGRSSADDMKDVAVLTRIVASPAKLVDSIIKYTNSQTPIKVWEMSARDKEQQRIRRELEGLSEPWFYALRRGEFDSVSDKDKFGSPDRRVLPFPQSIQYLAAFRGLPVQAYKDKARLFTTLKDRVLPPGLHPTDLLWSWHVGQAVIAALPGVQASLGSDPDAMAILKRGAQFYATAIAAQLLVLRNGQDYSAKVEPARLRDKALALRLEKYATAAIIFHVRAVKQLKHSGRDLGLILRSPDTNSELQKWVNEQMVEERLAPKALEEKLPKLPGIKR